ncbi:hypothetical protein P20652_0496 [Pseudoalteromonas sp. BSi20652]|nr:hypothetical protein P20652_0496 [Pseudoalteromonas sp. BSi20652]
MYIDVSVFNNYEPWWFWSFYSISINVVDLSMIAIFFINKNSLSLHKFNLRLLKINT